MGPYNWELMVVVIVLRVPNINHHSKSAPFVDCYVDVQHPMHGPIFSGLLPWQVAGHKGEALVCQF